VATIVTAVFGTLLMGLYANPPFAIVPYMRENALVVHTVVQVLGYRWQTALAAVFAAGAIFLVLSVSVAAVAGRCHELEDFARPQTDTRDAPRSTAPSPRSCGIIAIGVPLADRKKSVFPQVL
jgi:hypothetical protein